MFATDESVLQTFREEMVKKMKLMDDKLKGVIGMDSLKETLREYLRDSLFDQLRRALGMQTGYTRPVMVFAGAPGTGKTSIAELVAGRPNIIVRQ